MLSYYGCISKSCNYLSDIIAIITKPCDTKEEAEEEYQKAFKALSRYNQCEAWGRVTGVIKLKEEKPVIIPEGKQWVCISIKS